MAHHSWQGGRRSKYLPAGLATRVAEALMDPDLLKEKQDLALLEGVLTDFTRRLGDRPLTARQQDRLLDLLEQRRKLLESQARRVRELQLMVPVDKVLLLVNALAHVAREFVPKEHLPKVQARLRELLLVHQATQAMPSDADVAL